ncbi:MAG TPA: YeeE/YedE family protein [Tepidisphaeraceae bacterium]
MIAAAVTLGIVWAVRVTHADPFYGPKAAFALASGAVFGLLLQRSRFCWFCNLRDLFERGDARPVLGIVTCLAVGTLGYLVIFGAWIVDPSAGHLPPKAHIGPLSWVVFAGGFLFGIGMTLSGSCISAHLYRLGEGSLLAPFALAGTVVGFILGFRAWDWLYLNVLATAPPVWLPGRWGYGTSIGAQLMVLAIAALFLARYGLSKSGPTPHPPPSWRGLARAVFVERWPSWVGGGLIGVLAVLVLFRTQPLGVTAEIHRLSRDVGTRMGLIDGKLHGLDTLAGCRVPDGAPALNNNALFVLALIAASFASAVLAGQFRPRRESLPAILLAAGGGLLLGLGSMVALGCSVGTALSGVMAFSASGWAFLVAMVAGVAITLPLRRRLSARRPAG